MKTLSFSVSEQNTDVLKILEQSKNKSDYICAAIREKFANEQSDIRANLTDAQRESLKKEIRETLVEMFGENLCLFGSVGGMVVPTVQKAPSYLDERAEPKTLKDNNDKSPKEKEEIVEKDSEDDEDNSEKMDTLANIFANL